MPNVPNAIPATAATIPFTEVTITRRRLNVRAIDSAKVLTCSSSSSSIVYLLVYYAPNNPLQTCWDDVSEVTVIRLCHQFAECTFIAHNSLRLDYPFRIDEKGEWRGKRTIRLD